MKEQYLREYKNMSTLVFASSNDSIEHSLPRYMRDVIRDIFKELSKNLFSIYFPSNSVRKMWGTFVNDNRDKIPESFQILHLRLTGHTENTPHANIVARKHWVYIKKV